MEKNEIKKALYKQNPNAKFQYMRKGNAYYRTEIRTEQLIPMTKSVFFEIPMDDMGDATFTLEMESKLLNRWIMDDSEFKDKFDSILIR